MRVAVYGGSFNPPHVGHAMVAGWLRWVDLVDEVWLVPAYQHAFDKRLAPFERRVRWCEALAAAVGPWVRVEPIEASLPTPSYTIDTLDALAARHPGVTLRMVVGTDVLPALPQWKRWDRIAAAYDPIVVARGGYPAPPDLGSPAFPDVSSTDVRELIAAGASIGALVPAGVAADLAAHGPPFTTAAGGPVDTNASAAPPGSSSDAPDDTTAP